MDEVLEIFARSVPEDAKKKSRSDKVANTNADIASEDEISSTISTISETSKIN
ncbi:14574_t:CDS:2, partial [Gigaspora margarita]